MKFFSASKAVAIVVVSSPLLASAFPLPNIVNWLAGRNLEQPPAVAAEVEQFPKFIPRAIIIPRNHTNSTHGDAPEPDYGHGHGLTSLRRSVDAPSKPQIQDIQPPYPEIEIPAVEERDHTPSYCPDCHL